MAQLSIEALQFPMRADLRKPRRNPPPRRTNAERRSREYLTEQEVEQLMAAASQVGRHGHRDATLILLAYRHGLRVSELINLRWEQIDFKNGLLHVNRLKQGNPSVHPFRGTELRAVRRLQRDYATQPYIFCSERNGPLSSDAIRKIIGRAGEIARLPFPVHPHMLRHACGYKLAQMGQDTRAIQHYLGHQNIHHTVHYTQLTSERFKDFWKE